MGSFIAVLDYGIGNLRSAEKALHHVGAAAELTADPQRAREAVAVVLPGVGAFGRCMSELRQSGLDLVALEAIEAQRPFLGICVGMQMLFERSQEAPGVDGLGVLAGDVCRIDGGVTVPHMGWNTVDVEPGSAVFDGIARPQWCYFVHSYAPVPTDPSIVSAWTEHGGRLVAAVESGSVWATQFHPEKSGTCGLAVLRNFVDVAQAAESTGDVH